MAIKNKEIITNIFAISTLTSAGVTGIADGMTLQIIKDGATPTFLTNSITEPSATGLPGIYQITLSANEMNANFISIGGIYSGGNVQIYPQFFVTEQNYLSYTSGTINTVSGNLTNTMNYLSTVSGNVTNMYNDLMTISGNINVIDNILDIVSGYAYHTNNIVNHLPSGLIDGVSMSGILTYALAMANGKFSKLGDVYTFYKQDNTTPLYELTISETERTRS